MYRQMMITDRITLMRSKITPVRLSDERCAHEEKSVPGPQQS